jgi:tryptophanyl-tRNA synthetase
MNRKRILSGIQPSGTIHIGNYFGMIKPLLSFQDSGEEVLCFLADYHSMTSLFDAKERKENSLEAATTLLACGLDPKKITFFRQSDVPQVTELAWMLSTVTPMGLLERCHSYKDKVTKGISANHGLFAYPVLMAADILIYQSNLVPVGKDQQQHLEVARDIAIKFNDKYGEAFVLPEPFIQAEVATVPGTDGQKMSKSYGNTLEVFGDEKLLKKKIMSIVMDSRSPTDLKPDADKNIALQLLKLVTSASVYNYTEIILREGKLGYGDLKKIVLESYQDYFAEARKKYQVFKNNPEYVELVLQEGAAKANALAKETMITVRERVGL